MSLIDSASLIVTPNAYSEGKLYSVIPSDGSGDMSVTRATTATRVNSAGLVELVPYNLLTYSEDFSNATWNKSEISLTSGQSSPLGTNTAYKITGTSAVNAYLYDSVSVTNGNVYTASVYLKGDTSGSVSLRVDSGSTAPNNPVSYTTEWQRFTYTFTAGSTTADVVLGAYLTWTGNEAIYVYGFQLVEGSVAKDYQKTETRLNIPRLDYSNGTCPSLLVEPQRTNLVTYSSSFDNAAWTKGNGTVTANATTSPSGITDADKFAEDSSTDAHYFGNDTATATSGQSVTFTIFAKQSERSWIAIRLYSGFGSIFGYYNIANGTLGTIGAGGVGNIEDYGNGWYRCSLTITMVSNSVCLPYVFSSTGNGTITFTGTSGSGIYVYGAQLEVGSYPTSYIPTTSASVTRNADVISKTGISSLIGQTEGVVFFDLELNNTPIADSYIFIRNSNASNYIGLRIQNNLIRYEGAVSASTTCSIPKSAVANTRYKVALAYNTNDFAMYVNGDLIGTDNVGTIGSMDTLDLNFNLPGVNSYEFNSVALWQTRLTNDQLATLTTL